MNNFRFPWFGIALVIFGGVILLHKLNVIEFEFSQIFWPLVALYGFLKVGSGFSRNKKGRIFWGTILFLYSVYFFLRSFDTVELHPHILVPASFLVVGIGFFMMYLDNFRDWYLLIPSLLLCGTGGAFVLADYGYIYSWDVWDAFHLYWPIGLILIGIAIILRRRAQVSSKPETQSS